MEDVISKKQIKFSSNLQDEVAEKCQIQSVQVEEMYKSLSCTGSYWSSFNDSSLFSHSLVPG
jgi:hypothetical protein